MPHRKIIYTWDQFDKDCLELARRISRHKHKRVALVALRASRNGGLFLARELNDLTGIEFFELNYTTRDMGGMHEIILAAPIHPGLTHFDQQLILATEMWNSGWVNQKASQDLILGAQENRKKVTVTFMAIHCRKDSPFKPDICLKEVESDVSYPWERVLEQG